MAKAKLLILDGVQHHIVSHLTTKNTAKEMWDAVATLFQNPSKNRKMFLKEKLRTTKMHKGEGGTPNLIKIQTARDELAVVGEAPQESELDTFVQGITGQDNILS